MNDTLPPLPNWVFCDDLGGLVPSEIRSAMVAYARAALAARPAVPAGMVLVPVEVLEDAATAIGHFVSDHEALDDLDAYIARHKANAAAPATPAATPSPAPAMGRDAFEAWATEYSTIPLERDDDDGLGTTGYTAMDQTMLWDAWQAAMTRAREAVGSVPVPRTWPIATSRHAWIIAQAFDDYRVAVLRALGGK